MVHGESKMKEPFSENSEMPRADDFYSDGTQRTGGFFQRLTDAVNVQLPKIGQERRLTPLSIAR